MYPRKLNRKEIKYFLIYTTANETDYSVDYANISAMCKLHPGVDKVYLFIVVSKVDGVWKDDKIAFSVLRKMIEKCNWLELRDVIFKTNIGRDFSSAQIGLKEVAKFANSEDEVMIRNRSAYGPFTRNWYIQFSKLLNSQAQIGLVGNTINLTGHHKSIYNPGEELTHVQTYVYLSRFAILKEFIKDFPGVKETDRLDLINYGELHLSKLIIRRNYFLACLLWPDHLFGNEKQLDCQLPKEDMKQKVLGLPFEHRKSGIKYPSFGIKMIWKIKRIIALIQRLRN